MIGNHTMVSYGVGMTINEELHREEHNTNHKQHKLSNIYKTPVNAREK